MRVPFAAFEIFDMSNWFDAFQSRTDLQVYNDNALALFALALRFRTEDLDTVAAESITDGRDDKNVI